MPTNTATDGTPSRTTSAPLTYVSDQLLQLHTHHAQIFYQRTLLTTYIKQKEEKDMKFKKRLARYLSALRKSTPGDNTSLAKVWIPIPTQEGKMVTGCTCYGFYQIMGLSMDECRGLLKELGISTPRPGYEKGFSKQILEMAKDESLMKEFPDLKDWLDKVTFNVQTYGGNLKWVNFSDKEITNATPLDEKDRSRPPPRWLSTFVDEVNGIETDVLEGSPLKKRVEFQRARKRIVEMENELEELITNQQSTNQQNQTAHIDPPPTKKLKRKNEIRTSIHKIGDETYPLPRNRIPITKDEYSRLLSETAAVRKGNIAVTEEEFEEFQRLRSEKLDQLTGIMDTAQQAYINNLHNRLVVSYAETAGIQKECEELVDKLAESEKQCEKMIENAKLGEKVNEMRNKTRYTGSNVSKSLYMLVNSICPSASAEAISQMAPAVLAAFFADLDLLDDMHLEDFANNTPSPTCMRDIIAVHRQLQMKLIADLVLADVPIFASFDKGHRNGHDYLVKELSWWDHNDEMVRTVRLQSDGSGGSSADAAAAWDVALEEIDYWIKKIDPNGRCRLWGQTTDSGGGGVLYSVKGELSKVDRINLEYYRVAVCTLHALNKALENGVLKCFGECSLHLHNFHHYLFSCYSVQDYLGETFEDVWKEATGKDYMHYCNKLQRPVLSRWWSVNVCAEQIVSAYDDWITFTEYVYNVYGTQLKGVNDGGAESKLAKTARSAIEVGKCKKIMADLHFFVGFGREYFKKHMNWLHETNPLSKTFGHSCNEMPLRAAMMKWELDDLRKNDEWFVLDNFKDAKNRWNLLDSDRHDEDGRLLDAGKETTMKQWKDFFTAFDDSLVKHTAAWYSTDFLPFAIASKDDEVSTVFACWLLGLDSTISEIIESNTHSCTIDLQKWHYFLKRCNIDPKSLLDTDFILSNNKEAISKIAAGIQLWEGDNDMDICKLRKTCKELILAQKHHQQSGEAAVRDMGICTRTRRGEVQGSSLTSFRSVIISMTNIKLRNKIQNEAPKNNAHRKNGTALTPAARKQDTLGIKSKHRRVRVTKEKSTMLIQETLDFVPDSGIWKDAIKRVDSKAISTAKQLRNSSHTEKRRLINAARNQRITTNQSHVSSNNIQNTISFTPLKYDGKVRTKSLRFKELVGFVRIQLKKRDVEYSEQDSITALKKKLEEWVRVNHEQSGKDGDPPEDIEVLLDEGEIDDDGIAWTIEKACEIIATKNNKRKG